MALNQSAPVCECKLFVIEIKISVILFKICLCQYADNSEWDLRYIVSKPTVHKN